MKKNQLRTEINDRLGQVLKHARLQSGRSISSLATALDLSEREVHAIEERPAEIPCCKLYRVIELYSPSAQIEVQDALCDIHFLGAEYRANRSWFEKSERWLRVQIKRNWLVCLSAVLIRLLIDPWCRRH